MGNFEGLFCSLSGFVRRDHQVMFDGIVCCHLSIGQLLLVDYTGVGNYKTSRCQAVLDAQPYVVRVVREFDSHPPAWLQNPIKFLEAFEDKFCIFV